MITLYTTHCPKCKVLEAKLTKKGIEYQEKTEKEYSLETLLTSLINIIQEKIVSKNIKLILNIDKTIPRNLIGDYNKVYQILLNIVTNSIKYTEVGRISITLNKEIQNSKIILKFIISDTGFGIKKEDYDKVFQKHTRLDDVVSRGIEGTGLGLSLTKKYVELLGGKIWFESVYAAGTDFYIDIPQQIANMDYTIGELKAPKENNLKQENLIDCSQYRILLVEDDKLNLEVTKRLFERYNFVIDTCTNGKDCIFKYKEGEQYNMILIDHKMPEMSGIEVMQVIRQLKDYKTPILVALTANAFSDSREMYIKDGFDDYLAKPVDINELDVLVNKYFNK